MSSSLVQCYNKGCGQKFHPEENDSQSCIHHPGSPYFHDAYKIWSCCQKKSTDFSTWLSFPGCTRGPHNPQKPPEPAKPDKTDADDRDVKTETIISNGYKPPLAAPRCIDHHQMTLIPLTRSINAALTAAITRQQQTAAAAITDTTVTVGTAIGTVCQNSACGQVYEGTSSDSADCQHHPGVPVFHEGLKFWSCCQKRTTEFDLFLEQQGCAFGQHCWTKKDEASTKQMCKEDWFSRGSDVVITIYAKGVLPDRTDIVANAISLKGTIVYNFGTSLFPLEYQLWGSIDPAISSVTMSEKKVEICLKKTEPISWPRLRFDPCKDAPTDSDNNS